METATVPQLQKFLVQNNTAGYIGVLKLDHRGEEHGENVEPFGTVWLSHEEMVLTARAPRRPEDNPFEEWTLVRTNPETQATEEYRVRPLTIVKDSDRYVPDGDRYVPTVDAPSDSAPAPTQTQARAPEPVASPASSGSTATAAVPPAPAAVAPQGAPVPGLRTAPTPAPRTEPPRTLSGEESGQSWTAPPEAPGQVLPGALGGENGDVPQEVATAAPDPTNAPTSDQRFVPSVVGAQAAPQTPGQFEEHAERVDPNVGEETGAARPPVAPPAEGEYASREEVGSPDAPDNGPPLVGG